MSYINNGVALEYPIGAVIIHTSNTGVDGWLICDGSAISRTTYQNLFSIIGTIYGVGDGSSTFNIPDLRDHFIRGGSNTGTITGASNGSNSITLDSSHVPSHTHTGTLATGGSHNHTLGTAANDNNEQYESKQGFPYNNNHVSFRSSDRSANTTGPINSGGGHAHSLTLNGDQSTVTFNSTLPCLFLNYIIKC
jgi:microcystin-dependent protein